MRTGGAALVWLMMVSMLGACAGRGAHVRCDARLEPINAPASGPSASPSQAPVAEVAHE